MAEEVEDLLDVMLACNAVHIASAAALVNVHFAQKTKRKHRVWINKYLLVRPQYGAYNSHRRVNEEHSFAVSSRSRDCETLHSTSLPSNLSRDCRRVHEGTLRLLY